MNITAAALSEVLAAHARYLWGDAGGARANLRSANLGGANLRSANLRSADLYGANLRSANLRSADLYGANLGGADLRSANLYGANLYGANLRSATGIEDSFLKKLQIVPEVGAFQAFKRVLHDGVGLVAHLEIPADALRVGGVVGRKCRASKATVLGFFAVDESPLPETVHACSYHDYSFVYQLGEEAVPTNGFSTSMVEECEAGIHFFLTFAEAAEYR